MVEDMVEERALMGYEAEGYRIRSDGTIWNPHIERWTFGFATWCTGKYYAKIRLWKKHRCRFMFVHRLVADHFVVNPRILFFDVVDHINNDSLDNRVENLRWLNDQLNSRNQKGKPNWIKKWKKWSVQVNGTTRGYFKDRAEAQRVRDEISEREFNELYRALTTGHY